MDPYYSNTVLLLHGDTNFVDTSPVNATLTNTGTVAVNTTTKKFGAGSMSFNGTRYLSAATNPAYAFGSGNFTIEFWMYITSFNELCVINYSDFIKQLHIYWTSVRNFDPDLQEFSCQVSRLQECQGRTACVPHQCWRFEGEVVVVSIVLDD